MTSETLLNMTRSTPLSFPESLTPAQRTLSQFRWDYVDNNNKHCYVGMYHTSEKCWFASSEVISRVKLEKSIIFLLIVPYIVVFGAIYSTCVVYTGQ